MMCTSQHLIPYNLNTSIVIQLLDIAHKLRTLSLHALYLEANINNADFKLFAKKRLFCPESEESRRHLIGANSVKLKSFCSQTSFIRTVRGHRQWSKKYSTQTSIWKKYQNGNEIKQDSSIVKLNVCNLHKSVIPRTVSTETLKSRWFCTVLNHEPFSA